MPDTTTPGHVVATRVLPFHHAPTGTFTYLVTDGRVAIVIDPVLDYTAASGRLAYASADAVVAELDRQGLRLEWILETHAHADHLSAGRYVQTQRGGKIAIGQGIRAVQATFKPIFNLGDDFKADGSQFDRLLADGETLSAGSLKIDVLSTPGHTSDSVTYLIGDAAFIGDTLFRPGLGSARCDFPGGDAGMLYDSIHKLLALPPGTRLFLCHDYPPAREAPVSEVTVAEQVQHNVHVGNGRTREDYIAVRTERDATLAMPALIIPSIQVNVRGGALPAPEDNGTRYLKVPLNLL